LPENQFSGSEGLLETIFQPSASWPAYFIFY
jgi:hypothetical protein